MSLKVRSVIWTFLFFGLITCHDLSARYTLEHSTLEVPEYRLIDLGPTQLSPRVLSRQCWPLTLSPRINNRGQVVGNRGSCGFFWDACRGFFHYAKKGETTYFVDIINDGTLMGCVVDACGFTKWFVWSESQTYFNSDVEPTYIAFPGLFDGDIFLRSMNDSRHIIGARRLEGNRYRSMYCNHDGKVKDMKSGVLLGVNGYGNMVGTQTNIRGEQPFVWNCRAGLCVINEDESSGKPAGVKKFGFPVIADDNTVFGSYTSQKHGRDYVHGYHWNSDEGVFGTIDLNKMKISAVNRLHILVGSQDNHAVISVNHNKPVDLADHVKGPHSRWHLIEATDVNDLGQIVGYGKYRGKIHLFLLDPIR
ncbi:MAG: hypothetical protein VX777_04825 [Chlamydiota bacterium]|nr:hypothetical protein [Chlamydiota bacterium]